MPAPFTTRTDLDVAVLWEYDEARLRRHAESGRIPSHAAPRHVKCPGGLVVIANRSGDVLWAFTLAKVEKRPKLRVADGAHVSPAYELVASRGRIRRPGRDDPKHVKINHYAPGAFKYFDRKTGQQFRVTTSEQLADSLASSEAEYADELSRDRTYNEGAKRRVLANAYERDPRARAACIAHHGSRCLICGFDFEQQFGRIGAGFIHVHHLRPLAAQGESQVVDPHADLIPVCPNCHAMLHVGGKLRSPTALRRLIRGATG